MAYVARVVALVLAAVSVAGMVVGLAGEAERETPWLVGMAWPAANLAVGVLLTLRRPRLLVGWLFLAVAFLVATGSATDVVAARGLARDPAPWWAILAAWYGEWYWIPMIYSMLVFVPLLFPTGRALSRRWDRIVAMMAAVLAVIVVTAALQETLDPIRGPSVANPIGIPGLGDVEDGFLGAMLAAFFVLSLMFSLTGVVLRYRRGAGVERQQMKWFTFGAAALIIAFVSQGIADSLGLPRIELIDITGFALPPITAAIAVLRYRLYAIDRIISRTVTYAIVTALLVGIYAGAVALLSAAIDPLAGQSPFAVAVATLAAAAMFRPALGRVRRAVDRRFNRARYDMQHTLDGFRERVRSDVDLDRLCADLVAVTDETLQPAVALVWLRTEEVAT